jgi:hypothetical protein
MGDLAPLEIRGRTPSEPCQDCFPYKGKFMISYNPERNVFTEGRTQHKTKQLAPGYIPRITNLTKANLNKSTKV